MGQEAAGSSNLVPDLDKDLVCQLIALVYLQGLGSRDITSGTVKFYVDRFLEYTQTYAAYKWTFYITQIGCGLAGLNQNKLLHYSKRR